MQDIHEIFSFDDEIFPSNSKHDPQISFHEEDDVPPRLNTPFFSNPQNNSLIKDEAYDFQCDVSKNIDHSKGKTDSFEEVSHIEVCNFASDNESSNSNDVAIDNFLKSLIVPSIMI